jgi:hypothetical protein
MVRKDLVLHLASSGRFTRPGSRRGPNCPHVASRTPNRRAQAGVRTRRTGLHSFAVLPMGGRPAPLLRSRRYSVTTTGGIGKRLPGRPPAGSPAAGAGAHLLLSLSRTRKAGDPVTRSPALHFFPPRVITGGGTPSEGTEARALVAWSLPLCRRAVGEWAPAATRQIGDASRQVQSVSASARSKVDLPRYALIPAGPQVRPRTNAGQRSAGIRDLPARPQRRHSPRDRPRRPHPHRRRDLRDHPLRHQRAPSIRAAAVTPLTRPHLRGRRLRVDRAEVVLERVCGSNRRATVVRLRGRAVRLCPWQ